MQAFVLNHYLDRITEVDGEVITEATPPGRLFPLGWLRYETRPAVWKVIPPWRWSSTRDEAEARLAARIAKRIPVKVG